MAAAELPAAFNRKMFEVVWNLVEEMTGSDIALALRGTPIQDSANRLMAPQLSRDATNLPIVDFLDGIAFYFQASILQGAGPWRDQQPEDEVGAMVVRMLDTAWHTLGNYMFTGRAGISNATLLKVSEVHQRLVMQYLCTMPHGLQPIELPQEWISSYGSCSCNEPSHKKQCAICLCDYAEQDILCTVPSCGHCMHADCIVPWLSKCKQCPLCRLPVPLPPSGPETQLHVHMSCCLKFRLPVLADWLRSGAC
jgi:hypothetical protein